MKERRNGGREVEQDGRKKEGSGRKERQGRRSKNKAPPLAFTSNT